VEEKKISDVADVNNAQLFLQGRRITQSSLQGRSRSCWGAACCAPARITKNTV